MVKKDPKGIWQEYMSGLSYNDSIGLGETVKRNENMVRGRQWEGVYAPDIDKPVFNILKRVTNYLIAMLVSDDIGLSLSLFNRVEDGDARIKLKAVEEQADQVMEYTGFRAKMRDVLHDAAVDGDGCVHVYFDPDADTGWTNFTGQIEAEVLDNICVFFGNTEESDPQKQPYILIEQRRLPQDVKDEMKKNGRPQDDIDSVTEKVKKIGYPCVVKPCSCGSSVGVSPVDNAEQLREAIELACKYESEVLIEQRIYGREFTQGYVGGTPLPPVEIIPKCGFYDYANKYIANATEEICPANITDEELALISESTKRGFEALRLDCYARFDYILDKEGNFWCLEANTLPGMTPTSLLPQEAAAVGIDYDSLCEKLALMALDKKKRI